METKAIEKKTGWPSLFENNLVDKLFNSPLDEYFNFSKTLSVPSINIKETDAEYDLCIATPGLEKKDFNMDVTEGILTISAEKEKEEKMDKKNGRFNRMEYNYSSWSRSFTLPNDCDSNKIKAEYKNGELKITIPKTEAKKLKNVKKIDIN